MIGDYYSHRGYIDYNHSNLKRNGKTRYITLNNKYKAKRGRIYFDEQELNTISALKRQHGDFMLFNVNTKDKTKNKELPESKWLQLIDCINKTHIKTAVMYGGGYVNQNINNAKLKLNTNNIRSMLCAIAASKFVVTTEGGVHHAAEALGVKCLVIFGGRIDPNILGYEDQINIIDNRTIISDKREIKYPCGMFSECIHCHEIMNDIPVSLIKKEILQNYD